MTHDAETRDDRDIPFGAYRIFPRLRLLLREGRKVELGRKAFDVLLALVEADGNTLTKDELLSRVWPLEVVEENNLQAQISALRSALGADRHLIATEFNRGYRLTRTGLESGRNEDGASATPPGLVARLVPLIGRERELAALAGTLSSSRLVTVVGAGGIGKTRLAAEFHRLARPAFPGGSTFVELARLTGPGLVRATIAASLVAGAATTNGPHFVVADASWTPPRLLILDNCEHLLQEAAEAVEAILSLWPDLSVLTTTQEPLGVEGEQVFRLQPLGLPPAGTSSIEDLLRYPCARLLQHRILANDRDAPLGDREAADLCAICRSLDGIPLAIELAAVRISQIGLRDVVAGLTDRFRLLTAGRRTAMPRHQTLRATLDWSFGLLNAAERDLLLKLGLFAGSFTLDAAHNVSVPDAADVWLVADLLGALASKSMILKEAHGQRTRFKLSETVRSFALEKVAAAGDFAVVAARHAAYFQHRLGIAAGEWRRLSSDDWVTEFADDLSDVRAALDWGLSSGGDPRAALGALCASLPFWIQLSLLDECRLRVERALFALPGVLEREPKLEMALNAALGASTTWSRGAIPGAAAAWERALEIGGRVGDVECGSRAHYGLWLHALRTGRYLESLGWAERLLGDGVARADGQAVDAGRRAAGVSCHFLGRHDEANASISSVIALGQPSAEGSFILRFGLDQRSAGFAFLARVQWIQGQAERSVHTACLAVDAAERLDHANTLCCALLEGSCTVATFANDLPTLERDARAAVLLAERHGLGFWRCYGQGFADLARLWSLRDTTSTDRMRASLAALEAVGVSPGYTMLTIALAEHLMGSGRLDEAALLIERLLGNDAVTPWVRPELMRLKARIARERGDTSDLASLLRSAFDLASAQGAHAWRQRLVEDIERIEERKGCLRAGAAAERLYGA